MDQFLVTDGQHVLDPRNEKVGRLLRSERRIQGGQGLGIRPRLTTQPAGNITRIDVSKVCEVILCPLFFLLQPITYPFGAPRHGSLLSQFLNTASASDVRLITFYDISKYDFLTSIRRCLNFSSNKIRFSMSQPILKFTLSEIEALRTAVENLTVPSLNAGYSVKRIYKNGERQVDRLIDPSQPIKPRSKRRSKP